MAKPFMRDSNGKRLAPEAIVMATRDFVGLAPHGDVRSHKIQEGTMGLYEGLAMGDPDLGVVLFEAPDAASYRVEVLSEQVRIIA